LATNTSINYASDGIYVRSGRAYDYDSITPDYLLFENQYGPSTHYTIVFNTFILMTAFNFFNVRTPRDELNIFKGLKTSYRFFMAFLTIFFVQLLLGTFGWRAFNVCSGGMSFTHWCISFAFAFGTMIFGFALKFVPTESKNGLRIYRGKPLIVKEELANLDNTNLDKSQVGLLAKEAK